MMGLRLENPELLGQPASIGSRWIAAVEAARLRLDEVNEVKYTFMGGPEAAE